MKKNKYLLLIFPIILIILFISVTIPFKTIKNNDRREYLDIVTTVYNNGINDDNGISLVLYRYDIVERTNTKIAEILCNASYPVAVYDADRQKVYYCNSDERYDPDNIFEYDLAANNTTQLTFGKFLFNDMFLYEDKLYLNTARQYTTVTQPAVMDMNTYEINYLDPDDDDTWCFSFSYNYGTDKFTGLAASDSEMRTYKVVAETHIRPKTIYTLDRDLNNRTAVFETEDYEITKVRQLDKNRMLITYRPSMASTEPARMKILYLDSQQTEELELPGIYEFQDFCPVKNAEGMVFTAMNDDRDVSFYYYDFNTKKLEDLWDTLNLPGSHRQIVNFVHIIQ